VQDLTEKLTPNRRHPAYKRFTSGFVVMVLIEETFEAGSARLIDTLVWDAKRQRRSDHVGDRQRASSQ
jgi:hypothetical protein